MDTLNYMKNDDTFDDFILNWEQTLNDDGSSSAQLTDTDSDSGIGFSSNSNSPLTADQLINSNEFINTGSVSFDQQPVPTQPDQQQQQQQQLLNLIDNNQYNFDENSFIDDLNADDLLSNLDLLLTNTENQQLLNDEKTIINNHHQQQQQPQQQINDDSNPIIIDDDDDIKEEPIEYPTPTTANNQIYSIIINSNNNSQQQQKQKNEKIINIINTLKSCNQQTNKQITATTTTNNSDDQQLLQLLNARQQRINGQANTNKQTNIKIRQQPQQQQQQQQTVIIPTGTNGTPIILTTAAATSQQPTAQILNCQKIVSIQPNNNNIKQFIIQQQQQQQQQTTLPQQLIPAKKIKIESTQPTINTTTTTTSSSKTKPLAPKLSPISPASSRPTPAAATTTTTTTNSTPSAISIIIPAQAQTTNTQTPTTATILCATPSPTLQPKVNESLPTTAFILSTPSTSTAVKQAQQTNTSIQQQQQPTLDANADPALTKKQFRMMKNRESACLSRKRKKEYMQSLEEKLKEIFMENQKLKSENNSLKEKVNKLLIENTNLKSVVPNSEQHTGKKALKRPLVMFAILFVMSINVYQFANVNGFGGRSVSYDVNENGLEVFGKANTLNERSSSNNNPMDTSLVHINSRTLLSDYDYNEDEQKSQAINKLNNGSSGNLAVNSSLELIKVNDTWHLVEPNLCSKLFNQTHTIKITDELLGWYERINKASRSSSRRNDQKKPQEQLPVTLDNSHEQENMRPRMMRSINSPSNKPLTRKETYELSLYNAEEKRYDAFAKKIRQRNDTFYVVSFRRDHFMLPALNHTNTQRPRISLVMPALNESGGSSDSIAFMQIDCEVIDLSLIYLKQSEIPINYVHQLIDDFKQFSTSSSSSSSSSSSTPKPTPSESSTKSRLHIINKK